MERYPGGKGGKSGKGLRRRAVGPQPWSTAMVLELRIPNSDLAFQILQSSVCQKSRTYFI